jgi:ribonuclease P protein component
MTFSSMLLLKEKVRHEENLPAEQAQEEEHAWLSQADEDGRRQKGARAPQGERAAPRRHEDVAQGSRGGELVRKRLYSVDRLKHPQEFALVREDGVRIRAGVIAVAAHAGGRRRLGIVAPANLGPAPVRNRLKRVIREYFRQHPEAFPKGACVAIPMRDAGKCENAALRRDLAKALRLLGERLARRPGP